MSFDKEFMDLRSISSSSDNIILYIYIADEVVLFTGKLYADILIKTNQLFLKKVCRLVI